jgi:hypothetical protein
MSASRLEPVELLNVHHEHNGTANGHFDRAWDEGAGGCGFKGHDVYDLLPTLAVLLEQPLEGGKLEFLGSDEDGGVAFAEETTGRTDHREFEASFDKLVRDPATVPVVNDADSKLQPPDYIKR